MASEGLAYFSLFLQNEFLAFANRPEVLPHIAKMESSMAPAPVMATPAMVTPAMTTAPMQQQMVDGTDLLLQSSGMIVKQEMEWFEAVSNGCCEQSNRYSIYSQSGQPMYLAAEESEVCFTNQPT